MYEKYLKLLEEHEKKFEDEYYTFQRVDFEDQEQLKKEIELLEKDTYITYEMQGWSKEDAEKIREGKISI